MLRWMFQNIRLLSSFYVHQIIAKVMISHAAEIFDETFVTAIDCIELVGMLGDA